ncbi:DUF4393 domain-containing protein [Alkalihalobacillus macyae]|uniref:DUF4393 domain-containing protein n=1 Tax=Guptibacillus hwajinpoensis TaxID=208199 RepID=UPI00273CD4D9|nr:DUF4393 domain-containing protein [Alkalihalobacillus macyae]MDP4550866.1 DUF4393 domain-containing protein [Alkalihalobacillus macyae]
MKDLTGIGELSANTMELVKMVYPDLLQPGVKKVGIALESTIDFLSIPVKHLGKIGQKSDINISNHLNNYKVKLEKVPSDEIGTVPPEIGVPIIEDLTRVTNGDLASMYVNLLVNASTISRSKYTHPSFINLIRSIAGDEAKIINHYKNGGEPILVKEFIIEDSKDGTISKFDQLFINLEDHIELQYPNNKSFYFSNLERLIVIDGEPNFTDDMASVVNEKTTLINSRVQENNDKIQSLSNKSLSEIDLAYKLTNYGKDFVRSISI